MREYLVDLEMVKQLEDKAIQIVRSAQLHL